MSSIFALVMLVGGLSHAATFNTTYPAFGRMELPERALSRMRDLNMVNPSFQGIAQHFHSELTKRVDTQSNSCAYLMLSNPVYRTVRKLLLLSSYLERSSEVPKTLTSHFGKMLGMVIKNFNKAEYHEPVDRIIDAWLEEIEAAGGQPVNFQLYFADEQRLIPLFEYAMWLNTRRDYTWTFTDFHTKK